MERSRQNESSPGCRCAFIVGAWALTLVPIAAMADGARYAQKANPGDIVLLRNVATRPADRNPTAPGMALMVSASPNPQLGNALQGNGGAGEMSDQEIGDLTAGVAGGVSGSGQGGSQRGFNPQLAQSNGGNNAAAANGSNLNSLTAGGGAAGGVGGSIVDGTRNISDQVTNAVSQIPMVGGGH